jgi:hypothetical protein
MTQKKKKKKTLSPKKHKIINNKKTTRSRELEPTLRNGSRPPKMQQNKTNQSKK